MMFLFLACTASKETDISQQQDSGVTQQQTEEIYCEPTDTTSLRVLYGHVGDLNSEQEGVPTGIEANGIEGVSVTSCNTGEEVISDEDGNWTIDVPDQDFVTFHVFNDGYLPSRWTIDPHYDGVGPDIKEKYSNTIGAPDFIEMIFGEADVEWDENLGILVVDVLNPGLNDPETGADLLGSIVNLSSPHEMAMVVDDEERILKEGNVLSQHSDVIFVNVEAGELDVFVETPDGSVCVYPENIYSKAGEIFHISVYCFN